MLELDPGAIGPLSGEADLDLARVVVVGLDLPGGADVPGEDDAGGPFVDEDPCPVAFRAVLGAVVDVATDVRFEHGFGDRGLEQVVLAWLEVAEPFGEDA